MIFADTSSVPRSFQRWLLPSLLAFGVLVLSLGVTAVAYDAARDQTEAAWHADFEYQARRAARRIEQRMATYVQVARSAQASMLGSVQVARDDFRMFVRALQLDEHYPGIQGVALVETFPASALPAHEQRIAQQGLPDYHVHPESARPVYSAITQIEPFTGLNLRALGYDMLTDPIRRQAMEQARDSGEPTISAKVKLIQENGHQEQPGVVIYLPLYQRGQPVQSIAQRREHLIGWIGAPFRMNDLMEGLSGERSDEVRLTIYDGDAASAERILYQSAKPAPQGSPAPLFSSTKKILVANRIWRLAIDSSSVYETRIDRSGPQIIGLVGLAVSFLLAVLVWTLASGKARADTIASAMTFRLRDANTKLMSEQRRIQIILDNTHDAFVAIDHAGRVINWNAQAERVFGWTASEAIGRDLAELIVPEESRAAHRHGLAQFVAAGNDQPIQRVFEVEGLHRNGQRIPVELAIAGVREASGMLVSAFIRDVSERKAAARLEATRTAALEEAQTALQHARRLEAVGKLTGGVAHDFNNVLQILSGNIQILERVYAQEARLQDRLGSMARAVERGAKLSADLLAFARRQPLRPAVLNLKQILPEVEDSLRRALGERFVLEVAADDGLWNTLVDRSQLENVILNLAVNSRDAMPEGGRIAITLANVELPADTAQPGDDAPARQYVHLAFSDDGGGMSAETIAHAFEPFYTTKRAGEGTGLGLSMAYGFVRQSGGEIRLQSALGAGTTVHIYLPRSNEAEAQAPQPASPSIVGGSETVLVVEDDVGVQATVVTMLEELGYRVVTADDGQGGLALLENGLRPDVLFSDVVMPGPVSSTELAQHARRLAPGVAVLFTSGYTHNALVQGGRLNEGVELLSKPYRREDLARRIRQVLEMGAAKRVRTG